jgi:uncharacterized Zn-finger protein
MSQQIKEQSDDTNVICPYCLNSYQPYSEDFDENDREKTCHHCGNVYILCDRCSITHHTRPKPEAKP